MTRNIDDGHDHTYTLIDQLNADRWIVTCQHCPMRFGPYSLTDAEAFVHDTLSTVKHLREVAARKRA